MPWCTSIPMSHDADRLLILWRRGSESRHDHSTRTPSTKDRICAYARIPTDVDAACHWVIDPVRLGARLIPDEDHRLAAVVELLQVRPDVLDIGHAPKSLQVVHRRCGPIPQLVECFAAGALCRRHVEDVDRGVDSLTPKRVGESTRLEHAPGHPNHCLVLSLDDAILLWRVWRRELVPNSKLGAVRREFCRRELSQESQWNFGAWLPSKGSRRKLSERVEGSSSPYVLIAEESSRRQNSQRTAPSLELGTSSRHHTRHSRMASSSDGTKQWSGWPGVCSRRVDSPARFGVRPSTPRSASSTGRRQRAPAAKHPTSCGMGPHRWCTTWGLLGAWPMSRTSGCTWRSSTTAASLWSSSGMSRAPRRTGFMTQRHAASTSVGIHAYAGHKLMHVYVHDLNHLQGLSLTLIRNRARRRWERWRQRGGVECNRVI